MPAGFPAYPPFQSPNSPKAPPISYSTSKSYTTTSSLPKKSIDTTTSTSTPANDTSSLYSTTSTMSLLKHPLSTLKAKLSYKEHMKKEEAKTNNIPTSTTSTTSSMPINSKEKTPRQALAETYQIMARR